MYHEITIIKIRNIAINPQSYLCPFLVPSSHPSLILSPPPIARQSLTCYL